MLALVDGDIVAYRCAASCNANPKLGRDEPEPESTAIQRTDEILYRICNTLGTQDYRVFLSSDENFRKVLDPRYKANRTQPKPEYLNAVRSFLVEEWGAELCPGYEADDGIGIAATGDTIVCSIDKDLKQISGWHFNFVKNELSEVYPRDAIRNFWHQMLTGDRSDNVFGIEGVGDVRAARVLSGVDPQEMEALVWDCYRDAKRSRDDFLLNYRLLRILRSSAELEEIEAIIREGKRPDITEACRFPYTPYVPKFDGE